jgi:hypothetical protein
MAAVVVARDLLQRGREPRRKAHDRHSFHSAFLWTAAAMRSSSLR